MSFPQMFSKTYNLSYTQVALNDQQSIKIVENLFGRPLILVALRVVVTVHVQKTAAQSATLTDVETVQKDNTLVGQFPPAYRVELSLDAPAGVGTQEGSIFQEFDGANLIPPVGPGDFRWRSDTTGSVTVPRSSAKWTGAFVFTDTGATPGQADYDSNFTGNFYVPPQNVLGVRNVFLEYDTAGYKSTETYSFSLNEHLRPDGPKLRFEELDAIWFICNTQSLDVNTKVSIALHGLVQL